MKKILLLVCCAFFVSIGIAQKKQVALVSFYSDKKIGGTGLGTAIESLINDPSFDLKPLVDKSYERFVKEFSKDFPFALIDHEVISGNEEYQKFHSTFLVDTAKTANKLMGIQYAVADGFVFAYGDISLASQEKRDACNLIKIFPDAAGILFVSMDYDFESRLMGLGAGVRAHLNMFLYDPQCKRVLKIRQSAPSKGKVPAVAGIPVMDPKKIQPLCEDATEELFKSLKGKLGKIVKKAGKL
jgi:hypothetical protein